MGVEGPADDPVINNLRERQMRNFLATLILSQGVPMLCGGDEFARSQNGNNNAYCQDNELTWFEWKLTPPRERLMEFTAKLMHLRRDHPNLHRRKFFQDRVIRGSLVRDIAWYNTDGRELAEDAWTTDWNRSLALLLNGKTLACRVHAARTAGRYSLDAGAGYGEHRRSLCRSGDWREGDRRRAGAARLPRQQDVILRR
jgi:glycogen operon protein